MELTYILVDFENVRPQDFDLLHGPQYRVKVFHGPHQNKLDVVIVKALQPLGEQVEYVQSEKPGKNALDFHIAFCMGRLVQAHESIGMPARFNVISKDGGFDSVLRHVRSLGYAARQAVSIRDALEFDSTEGQSLRPAPSGSSVSVEAAPASPSEMASAADVSPVSPAPAITQIQPDTKAAPARKPAAPKKATASGTAIPPKQATPTKKAAVEDAKKVIEHLRKHGKNRPAKRVTLERHILSLLGGETSAAAVQAVVAELERRRVVSFGQKQVKYTIPNPEK